MVSEVLSMTGNLLLDPLVTLWYKIVSVFPSIVLAIILLILGYIVGWAVGHAVKVFLFKIGIDKYIKKSTLTRMAGHTDLPTLIGEILKWLVFFIFLQEAAAVLDLGTLSNVLGVFVAWLPNLVIAILVFFAGIALAHYVDYKIKTLTKMRGMLVLGGVLKAIIIILAVLVGLEHIGVNVGILQNTFLIIIGAFGLGIALALGIGLGLGLRSNAEDFLKKLKKNI
ncbi:MAG TPA: hypothetical protein VJB89_01670 [Candidatus Nanoarchaeia archaeon]|nr:hypothetical protein [Candidatus Nanoarchaeia archaeon]